MGRSRVILLAIICLLLFTAGIFVGNITVSTTTRTITITEISREEATIYTTVTAEPPLLVIARAELHPSCIYNETLPGPEEDPNCTRNVKAVALVVVVRNFGRIPVKVSPKSILIHGFGVGPSPYFTNPEDEVVVEPGSYSREILAVYLVTDPESFIRFYNGFGHIISVEYSDEEGSYIERIEEKPELVPGVWWPRLGS